MPLNVSFIPHTENSKFSCLFQICKQLSAHAFTLFSSQPWQTALSSIFAFIPLLFSFSVHSTSTSLTKKRPSSPKLPVHSRHTKQLSCHLPPNASTVTSSKIGFLHALHLALVLLV